MKPLIRPTGWAVVLAAVLLAGFGRTEDPPKKPAELPKTPTVMQRKLTHAQRVLEGLALNDFNKIKKGADELTLCAEEASWRVVDTPKYALFSNDFLRNLDGLKKAAKAKNIDAAALAYVDMTLTCVKCHQYVRDEKMGAAPDLTPLRSNRVGTE